MAQIEKELADITRILKMIDQETDELKESSSSIKKSLEDQIERRESMIQDFEKLVSGLSVERRKELISNEAWEIFGDKYKPE